MAYMVLFGEVEVKGLDGKCMVRLEGPTGEVWDSSGFLLASGAIDGFDAYILDALLSAGLIKKT